MFRIKLLCCLALVFAVLSPVAPTYAQDDPWHLRFGGIWVDPDADFTDVDGSGNRVNIGTGDAIGLGLAVERQFNRRLGLELGGFFAEPDIIVGAVLSDGPRIDTSGGISLRAITLGLNFHFTPDKAVDVYAGPLLAHVTYGDLRFVALNGSEAIDVRVSSSDNFTVGAQVGADIGFGDSAWSLNLVGRYLDSSLDAVTGEELVVQQLDFDSLIVGVGVGYRF